MDKDAKINILIYGFVIVLTCYSAFVAFPTLEKSNNEITKRPEKIDIEPGLGVTISHFTSDIFERTEFKVLVFDTLTRKPIENANVSFILPTIFLHTNKEGYVYFSAPYISKVTAPHIRVEHIASPEDINCSFPLSVKKDGYENYSTSVSVHIQEN